MKNLFALFLAFSAFFYSHLALSQTAGVGGWRQGISSTGQSIWFGPDNATSGSRGIGQAIWNNAMGGVEVTPKVNLPTPSGPIDIVPKGKITSPSAAGAIGRAIPKLIKQVSGPLGVGMILYDLAKELGFTLSKDASGELVISKNDPNFCTAAPCYQYYIIDNGYHMTIAAAGAAFAAYYSSPGAPPTYFQSCAGDYDYAPCTTKEAGGYTRTAYLRKIQKGTAVDPATHQVSSSNQEFLDAIAAKSGWPSSSNLAKTLKQSLDIEPLNYVPMEPLSTTGPASVSAPPVKEVSNDGTNTTEKTTIKKTDLEYGTGPHPVSGTPVPKVTGTTNTTTNITITNNTTGAVTNSSSTVNNPAETPPDLGEITDTPFAALPKLYDRKYPDGLTGVWNKKIIEIKAAPLFKLVGNLMPTNIGSSGSCPAFAVPVNFGKWGEYGSLDFSPPCFIWDFGKAIILISALLLSRRLIFGG